MAEQPYKLIKNNPGSIVITWKDLANGDHAQWIDVSDYADKTAHIYGALGVGGSISLYGSNNPADITAAPSAGTAVILKDNSDDDITKTAVDTGSIVIQNYRYLSAEVTAGDGDTLFVLGVSARRIK